MSRPPHSQRPSAGRLVWLGGCIVGAVALALGLGGEVASVGAAPPTPAGRAPTAQPYRGPAPDLGAGLRAAPPPAPPSPTVRPTEAVFPATLTPTPRPPPTATPTPLPPSPTAVVALVAAPPPPAEPVPPPQPTAAAERPAPAEAPAVRPRVPSNALPFTPRPPPTRSYVAGLPDEPGAAGWLAESLLWLGIPSRTQYDGTPYQAANCGPSALGMILEAYGLWMPTSELRAMANTLQGTYGANDGIALDYLAEIARRANLKPFGLYGERGYRRWTVEEVREVVSRGYPVIALTVYRLLPWSGGYGGNVNHYIVISGLVGDDFLYNDSAFGGGGGRGLVITAEELERAWAQADIPRHAVAFGLGEAGYSLLGLDPARFGRGAGAAHLLAASVLAPTEGSAPAAVAAGSAAPADPADPAAAAREALLRGGPLGPALLDAPPGSRTTTASFAPSAVMPAAPPSPPLEDDTPPADGAGALLRVLLVLVAVGGLYGLLLVQAALARLRRLAERLQARAGRGWRPGVRAGDAPDPRLLWHDKNIG